MKRVTLTEGGFADRWRKRHPGNVVTRAVFSLARDFGWTISAQSQQWDTRSDDRSASVRRNVRMQLSHKDRRRI